MIKIITKLLLAILSFSFHFISSQNVEGKILDQSNFPISYATIQINTDFGVYSNDEGEFNIQTEQFKPTDSVTISYLGYKTLKFILKDFTSKDYVLEEDINELSEITVSNKIYSLDEILKNVKQNIDSNYTNTILTKKQIFQRHSSSTTYKKFEFEFLKATLLSKKALKKVNNSFNDLIIKNINQTSKYYSENLTELLSSGKKKKLNVIKATKLVNKTNDKSSDKFQKEIMNIMAKHFEKDATYKVSSGLFPVEDSLKMNDELNKELYKEKYNTKNLKNNINHKLKAFSIKNEETYDFIHKTKKYNYVLKGTSTHDNEKIYIVEFSPRKSSAKYKGTLYINSYDFAVVKLKYGYAKGKSFSKNLKFLLGFKFAQSKNNVEVFFNKNNTDSYSLQYIKQETDTYAFINRSLKFKKNRKDRKEDKRVLKMEFLLEIDSSNKMEFFVLNENEISNTTFNSFKEKKEYKMNYIPKYDSSIWKGYNVLSPVNEIKNYDTGMKN